MNDNSKNGNNGANKARRIDVEKFTMMQARQKVVNFIKNNPIGVLVIEVPTGGGKTYGLPYIIKNDIIPCLLALSPNSLF